jgi:hypothetical protein
MLRRTRSAARYKTSGVGLPRADAVRGSPGPLGEPLAFDAEKIDVVRKGHSQRSAAGVASPLRNKGDSP